jgi:predicted RecA/RadA family phage recombinase
MINYVQEGETLTLAAPTGGVSSGDGMLVGDLFGVASYDALVGVDVECALCGVFDLAKVSAQAWTQGASVYWDDSAKLVTTTASTNTPIGHAAIAAANPSATGRVRLEHGPAGVAGPGGAPSLNATIALTNGDSGYVVAPAAGNITRIDTVLLGGAVTTNDAVCTFKIGAAGAGVAITTGVITITASGSAIGDKDTCSPTAARAVVAGDLIYCSVSGTPGGSRTATVSILIQP